MLTVDWAIGIHYIDIRHPSFCPFSTSAVEQNLRGTLLRADKPEAPGQPIIDEIYAQSSDITWSAPTNDGGAAITHSVVEHKKKGQTKWEVPVFHLRRCF